MFEDDLKEETEIEIINDEDFDNDHDHIISREQMVTPP